jgi:hypothetical protein
MKRAVLLSLFVAVVVTAASPAKAQTTVLDQVQAVVDTSVGGLAIGGTSDQRLAQTVTVGIDGRLIGVMLPVGCDSGRLVVEIRDVVGGEPGPTVLARRQVRADRVADVGAAFQFIRVFSGGVTFSAGDQFAIVLDNPSGSCGIFRGPVGDSYPGGEGFFEALPNPPGWVPFSDTETRLDLPFMTVVRTP